MPIETNCPSCGRLLRVADEHAGRQARCPVCNTIYVVPGGPADSAKQPVAAEGGWYMRTPEQQVYGPVSQAELLRWLEQGRISASCQLRSDESPDWRPADEYFGVLRTRQSPPSTNPFATAAYPPSTPAPFGRPAAGGAATRQRMLLPHRGGLILVFGILAWFTCPLFAILAWSMGSSDLREMQCGRMDPGGQALTQAGRMLGMINVLLWIGMVVVMLFVGMLSFVA